MFVATVCTSSVGICMIRMLHKIHDSISFGGVYCGGFRAKEVETEVFSKEYRNVRVAGISITK